VSIQTKSGRKLTPVSSKCKDRFKWERDVEEKEIEDISVVSKGAEGRENEEDALVVKPSRTNRYILHPCTSNLLIIFEYRIVPLQRTGLGSVSTNFNRPKARQTPSRRRSEDNVGHEQ
jgi:hypothetical protein